MAKTKEVEAVLVKMSLIDADPLQPRKSFDPARLAELIASIKKHGILNPLIIEEADGRYIIVDGERRYRASKELKLNEVPAIIVSPQSTIDRLIQQFHLQEQHQNWSATEKAVAVANLSKELGYSATQIGELLSLPARTIADYVNFSKLINKDKFVKNEIPVAYARTIVSLRNSLKRSWMKHDKEFTQEMESDFEDTIITRIKSGDISNMSHFSKIKDIFTTDYKAVTKFMSDTKVSTDSMFLSTHAKKAMHERALQYAANGVFSNARQLRALGGFSSDENISPIYKKLIDELKALGAI